MKYRYHHLHLICSDLNEMIDFFTEILVAELVVRRKFGTADGATVDLDGIIINLRVANEDEEIVDDASKPQFGYHHLGLEVDDLDAAYKELTDKGYLFTTPPKDLGEVRVAFFKGPDNITIELIQPLG